MIDLPSDCALVAVKACYELARSGVTSWALAVTYKKKPAARHIIAIFEFEGQLRAYDREGSVSLPKWLTFQSSPDKIAKSWTKSPPCTFGFKALKGEWY